MSATGMRRMATISSRLVSGVGFSKGWAEFALKKPPPLVPSCLIASWEATGPIAMSCSPRMTFFVVGCPFSSRTGFPSAFRTGSPYSTGCTTGTFT